MQAATRGVGWGGGQEIVCPVHAGQEAGMKFAGGPKPTGWTLEGTCPVDNGLISHGGGK